jgi:hypothetical protein
MEQLWCAKIVSHERLLTTDRGGHNARRVKRNRRDLPARHQVSCRGQMRPK